MPTAALPVGTALMALFAVLRLVRSGDLRTVLAAALSVAGHGGPGFTFVGYLPRKPGDMRRLLRTLVDDSRPAVAVAVSVEAITTQPRLGTRW